MFSASITLLAALALPSAPEGEVLRTAVHPFPLQGLVVWAIYWR